MKTLDNIKSQYGYSIKEQKLKHINDVENGLKCECFDPNDLNKRLVAKQGEIKKHHFSYYNENPTSNNINTNTTYICNESKEHKECKMNIVNTLQINSNPPILLKRAEPEKHKNILTNTPLNFVPDIQAITISNEFIFVEIVKCNDINEEKFEKIKRENITTIKIYINDDYKNTDVLDVKTVYIQKNTFNNYLYEKAKTAILNKNKAMEEQQKLIVNKFDECEKLEKQLNIKERERKDAWRKYYEQAENFELILKEEKTLKRKHINTIENIRAELDELKAEKNLNKYDIEEHNLLKEKYIELNELYERLSL